MILKKGNDGASALPFASASTGSGATIEMLCLDRPLGRHPKRSIRKCGIKRHGLRGQEFRTN